MGTYRGVSIILMVSGANRKLARRSDTSHYLRFATLLDANQPDLGDLNEAAVAGFLRAGLPFQLERAGGRGLGWKIEFHRLHFGVFLAHGVDFKLAVGYEARGARRAIAALRKAHPVAGRRVQARVP